MRTCAIAKLLNGAENAFSHQEVYKRRFTSERSFAWKAKYSGMDAGALKRLKELEEENRRLKQMYADFVHFPVVLKMGA